MVSFRPKLLDTLPGYDRAGFAADLSAGITVGVLALPLAMAFAIASGMSPAAGIWTAIVAGLLISLLGGSRVQIGGPTGAFIPIIYAIVVDYGVANLLVATMMSGVMLLAMGAFRLGNMIRFIPLSVVIGFTNGIAVVIFISQIKDFLGLQIEQLPGEFFAKMQTLAAHLHTIQLPTVLLAVASLAVLLGWNRLAATHFAWMRRLPGPLAVLIIATALNALLALPVDTIGSRFGGIPQSLPDFGLPDLSLGTLGKLIAPALTIALLGAIESLLSARVADSQIDDRHDPNQELMAQGVANIAAPLFGGFAATGAIARTATNIRTGGRTPVAGMIHAGVLLAVVLALAPLASHIPLATLSAIVVVVSINMGEWHAFAPRELARFSVQYRTILLGTFLITVLFDLTLAVEIGLALASLFFIYRMSDLTRIERIPLEDHYGVQALSRADGGPRILAYRMYGSLFFGAANKLENLLLMQHGHPDVVILDMGKVISIDTTGLDILQTLQRNLDKRGAELILCDLNSQPGSLVFRSGFLDTLGEHNVAANLTEALIRAQQLDGHDPEISYV
ncbi:STAS domain-containing protein [Thauera sp. CAU 1555]|uniref:STAS domain-containing protein n=1 Tax=Thauera sedimentorum TaxID=2767595 RepID=A0ABR9BE70_9RHOO|nr:SulP family inorganic anion transporter [Thauera sedimentorum]MBC9073729.1 STAS domain-containing protein [Thauera sedimentorum]MBD8504648.1 STAS domain-containing protein [Thauera sedimentorum]